MYDCLMKIIIPTIIDINQGIFLNKMDDKLYLGRTSWMRAGIISDKSSTEPNYSS